MNIKGFFIDPLKSDMGALLFLANGGFGKLDGFFVSSCGMSDIKIFENVKSSFIKIYNCEKERSRLTTFCRAVFAFIESVKLDVNSQKRVDVLFKVGSVLMRSAENCVENDSKDVLFHLAEAVFREAFLLEGDIKEKVRLLSKVASAFKNAAFFEIDQRRVELLLQSVSNFKSALLLDEDPEDVEELSFQLGDILREVKTLNGCDKIKKLELFLELASAFERVFNVEEALKVEVEIGRAHV